MKATIKRPDGTVINLDGATSEDVENLAGGKTVGAPHICAPCLLPHFPQFIPVPYAPVPAVYPFVWPPSSQPWITFLGDAPAWPNVCGAAAGQVFAGNIGTLRTPPGNNMAAASAAIVNTNRASA